jgi:ABC-type phosphate transport system substrate-binding protein
MVKLENWIRFDKLSKFLLTFLMGIGLNLNGYQVIVNKELQIESISRADLKNIYLGKKSRWDGDIKIEAVTLSSGDTHSCFLTDIVQKTPAQFGIYWKRVIFTGKGVPFHKVECEEDMVSYVESTCGAVGYISEKTSTGEAKKIRLE